MEAGGAMRAIVVERCWMWRDEKAERGRERMDMDMDTGTTSGMELAACLSLREEQGGADEGVSFARTLR